MSKKDYELIANALKAAQQSGEAHGPEAALAFAVAARFIGRALGLDNPRFDLSRFLAACAPA